jgi:hypothetical protein
LVIRRQEDDMDDTAMRVLHWRPEENRWVEVGWDDFGAFRALFTPFRPLAGVGPGVHHFVVCACGEEQTWNIIPHKYLVEPSGKIGRDNFYGWNREEREDLDRLMIAREFKPGEEERLRQIQGKGGPAMYPPRESLCPLVRALPYPSARDSAAIELLDAVAAGVSRSQLNRAS